MRIIFEEHQYQASEVQEVLADICVLQDVEKMVSVNYVGYFYNSRLNDCVFILPKVLLTDKKADEDESVPEEYILDEGRKIDPVAIMHPDGQNGNLSKEYRKFIYEFSIWIYRALCVYRKSVPDSKAIYYKQLPQEGRGRKHQANTLLDIILSMIRFNRENQNFFLFTIKNIHAGNNKINWTRTIARNQALMQNDSPIYLEPTNKKRKVNFDEELFIIFFSILRYLNDTYGFKIPINCNYELLPKNVFEQYIHANRGKKQLLSLKYKYFSDKALELWNLCYAFFDQSHQLNINTDQKEYLLAKNFNIVFEAIIDDLIGDPREQIPSGLKDQYDGKRVDHMYRDVALTAEGENKNLIYYIGDSKYYKLGHDLGRESVYKQYTYARNVIQWNINLFLDDDKDLDLKERKERNEDRQQYKDIRLRGSNEEDLTEGYNILPNFFISAFVDKNRKYDAGDDNLKNHIIVRNGKKVHNTYISYQFTNRLFDRDTLVLSHYDVNFLYVIYLYARGRNGEKLWWKNKVRETFRKEIRQVIESKFEFRAMTPHRVGVDKEYIKTHFQNVLGKIYTPYKNKKYYSLALDRTDPEGNNDKLLEELRRYFYVTDEIKLGEDPSVKLDTMIQNEDVEIRFVSNVGLSDDMDSRCVLTGYIGKNEVNYCDFEIHKAKSYDMRYLPSSNLLSVKYFLPMVGGFIDGMYKVSKISLRTKTVQAEDDSSQTIEKVFIHFDFDKDYIKFGDNKILVFKEYLGSGQLHTLKKIMDLYFK